MFKGIRWRKNRRERGESNNNEIAKRGGGGGLPPRFSSRLNGQSRGRDDEVWNEGDGRCNFFPAEKNTDFSRPIVSRRAKIPSVSSSTPRAILIHEGSKGSLISPLP